MANVPVMSDKTGQQIAKHLREHNAVLEAAFEALLEKLGKREELFAVEASVEHNDDGSYKGLVLDTSVETAISNIGAAIDEGKVVILRVFDGANNIAYYAPLSSASGLGTDAVTIGFGSLGQSNPAGSVGNYSLTYVKGLAFMSGLKVDPSGLGASAVFCDMTVDGVKYTNVADVLTALAAKHTTG